MSSIPTGWTLTRIDDVAKLLRGVTYKKAESASEPFPDSVPILRATNIGRQLDFDGLVHVPEKRVSEVQFLRRGDIVIAASSGSLSVVGKAAPLRESWSGSFGAFCFALRPEPTSIEPEFLAYFLQTQAYRNTASRLAAGVNINNLKRDHLESLRLPLAPLGEQRQIVKALDSHFSRLDAVDAALERAHANLKRYRSSILKAAVEGRLAPTEADLARKEGRDYEPASVLLERILVERRRRWEETELEKLIAKGKPPKNDKWRAKYKEPPAPDTSELPGLPEGWCWATLGQLGEVTGGLTQNAKRRGYPIKVPFLRVANVYANRLELHDVRSIGVHQGELDRVQLHEGDMLVVEGNGSPDQIGRVALWDGSVEPCAHQNHLIKVRFTLPDTAVWAVRYMLSPGGRERVRRVASSTSGLHTPQHQQGLASTNRDAAARRGRVFSPRP